MTDAIDSPAPIEGAPEKRAPLVLRWARANMFLLLVVVPTLIAAFYLFFIASPQYRSEAQFVVRGIDAPSVQPNGMGQLLGMTGSLAQGQQEAQSIREYLVSPDAILALKAQGIDVAALYQRPGIDILSRLWANPKAETVLDYYRDHVAVTYDPADNITRLSVRAFTPGDARRVAQALLKLGEDKVNALNVRLFDASLRGAAADMGSAERDLATVQLQLGSFRERNRDIDPAASGASGQRQVDAGQAELDRQMALLADMRRQLSPNSPQVRAMAARVQALAASVGAARNRVTGQPRAVSTRLGEFEDLRLQQDFAAKRYEAARARYEEERVRAAKERLYVIQVVEPNLPERPSLPRPWRTSLLIFIGLCVAYGIGWMLLAGVREHQL